MVSDQYKKPYLDSSLWISWIKGEIRDDIDCASVVNHILTLAETGEYPIYINTGIGRSSQRTQFSRIL